jgi:hypothetical protein
LFFSFSFCIFLHLEEISFSKFSVFVHNDGFFEFSIHQGTSFSTLFISHLEIGFDLLKVGISQEDKVSTKDSDNKIFFIFLF